MSSTHQKHSSIPRAQLGKFGRNEWAMVGFTCSVIQQLAQEIKQVLTADFNIAYVDADHQSSKSDHAETASAPKFELTDKIDFYQLNWQDADFNLYKKRIQFNEIDLVLVNGNHFEASRQLVCIDSDRLASLQKRLAQLTKVKAFILKDHATEIPNFLKENTEDWQDIPVFIIDDKTAIIEFIQDDITANIPIINGLVLAGGKSQRMGQDKGSIQYFNQPHRDYLAELIAPFCKETFISTKENIQSRFTTIRDTFVGMGPMGAILSAFQQNPDVAWLVLACDYPLMNKATIQQLVDNRQPPKVATAFQSIENEFPEPLITIYEPKSYPVLLQFLAQGYACPRKMLINSNIHLLPAAQLKHPEVFQNVNHPNEMKAILKQLSHVK